VQSQDEGWSQLSQLCQPVSDGGNLSLTLALRLWFSHQSGDYCVYHVKKEHTKVSARRSELQSGSVLCNSHFLLNNECVSTGATADRLGHLSKNSSRTLPTITGGIHTLGVLPTALHHLGRVKQSPKAWPPSAWRICRSSTCAVEAT
jgi:hypothetical protein